MATFLQQDYLIYYYRKWNTLHLKGLWLSYSKTPSQRNFNKKTKISPSKGTNHL
jgi:hypothetical protein